MFTREAVLISITLAVLVTSARSFACSCGPKPSVETAAKSELIFIAEPIDDTSPQLRVTRVYKGAVPRDLVVHQSDCYSVIDGMSAGTATRAPVIVYGYRGGDRVSPTMWGRTAFVADAQEDIAYLDRTFPQQAPPSVLPSTSTAPPPPAAPHAPAKVDPPPRAGCGCGVGNESMSLAWLAVLASIATLAATRRRGRSEGTSC